jgi:hypothetical protein
MKLPLKPDGQWLKKVGPSELRREKALEVGKDLG